MGDVELREPGEVLAEVEVGVEGEFHAPVTDRSDIREGRGRSRMGSHRLVVKQVECVFLVDVEDHVDLAFQEGQVESDVILVGLFPAKIPVPEVGHRDTALSSVVLAAGHLGVIGPGADALLVAGASVAGAEFQVDARVLHEGLVAEVPSERNGGEPAPAVLGGEFRRTVRAQCRGEHVTVFVAGGDTSEIGLHRVFVERSGDVVEFRRCIDDVERRRGESAHVDVILLAGHILIGVAQHGTEIDVAELVVIVGVDLERGVGHVAVSLHQTSHARTVGMVLVIVGIVVGEAQVGVVVGLNLQFVVEKVELGEEIAQDAVILDIGDLLVEDLHGVVERELGSAAGVISPPGV